jgi:hypothetical protein
MTTFFRPRAFFLVVFLVVVIMVMVDHTATKAFVGVPWTFRRTRLSLSAVSQQSSDAEKNAIIVLPIFPLQKRVILPTEQITLNLYEERYLQMAEHVLNPPEKNQRNLFGAVYASHKPQVVKGGGDGPIVPMMEPGDVGCLCCVLDSEEAFIPTVGGTPRRRIRLTGRGAVSLRINRILCNGYGGGDSCSNPVPYILAEVEPLLIDNHTADEVDTWPPSRCQSDNGMTLEEVEQITELTSKALAIDPAEIKSDLMNFAVLADRLPDSDTTKLLELLQQKTTKEISKSVPSLWSKNGR